MRRMWCRVRYSASARGEVIDCREQRRGVEDGGAVRLLEMVNGGWKTRGMAESRVQVVAITGLDESRELVSVE